MPDADQEARPGLRDFENLCAHLTALDLPFRRAEEDLIVFLTLQRPTARLEVLAQWHPSQLLEWVVVWPFLVPDERRAAVSEAVLKLNIALQLGRFDYDVVNRRLVFRIFHAACGQPVTQEQIKLFVSVGVFVFDTLYLALQDVCLRTAEPSWPLHELLRATAGKL